MPVVSALPRTKWKLLSPLPLRPSPLRVWHLLSLDAPAVAAVWACLLADTARLRPSLTAALVLVLGSWLVYVADRLLDVHGNVNPLLLRERHHFARRYRRRFVAVAILVAGLMTWLILTHLSGRARTEDVLIFSAALLYFAAVHWRKANLSNLSNRDHTETRPTQKYSLQTRWHDKWLLADKWLSKELAIAVLFAAATAIPAWSRTSSIAPPLSPQHLRLALATAIFAAVCWLNCIAIEHWEANDAPAQIPRTATLTQWSAEHLAPLSAAFAGCVLALTPLSLITPSLQPLAPVLLSAAASALLFLFLEQRRDRVENIRLRIAADVALLTPLVVLPLLLNGSR